MDLNGFSTSLTGAEPPQGLSLALQTLWWDAKGDWQRAHACAQDDKTTDGAAVHAYLHRVEGDLNNARYWYNRAERTPRTDGLAEEWMALVKEMLAR